MRILLPVKRPKLYMTSTSSPELEIQEYTGQGGLYSAVVPDEASRGHLYNIARQMGFDIDPSKLHCTVMYSKEPCPAKDVSCDDDRVYRARFTNLQHWDGHDKTGYLTAALTSPELVEEHNRLKELGCVPTFDYNPHVTIWAGAPMTDKLQSQMDAAQANIDKLPELRFIKQFIGDLKDD
jgi:hypothetical protein